MKIISTFLSNTRRSFIAAVAIVACASLAYSPAGMAAGAKTSKAAHEVSISKVSLNKANAETLAEVLKGVGLKKAEAIVAWRKANGKFTAIEQLAEVKGIGVATIEKNRNKLTL